MKVVEHDPTGQQTLVQLNFGKLRSRVVSIHQLGGRFEVRTPLAVIHVLGTDFFTEYDAPRNAFRVICYSGSVKISGVGKFEGRSENIRAGQMLEVGSAFGEPLPTPNAVQQDSIAETTAEGAGSVNADSHLLRTVLIAAGAAAAGVVVGLVSSSGGAAAGAQPSSSSQKKPGPQ
jgi:hypothetical protein